MGWESLALTISIAVAWIQIGLNKTYSIFILSMHENIVMREYIVEAACG